ncbi:MAG: FkbM family methyltransferase, partial [Desulfovibrionaceae bacterium]|nr:FkbM family methyltransferase [Desulfovibrionaceae bacterium]
FEPNPVTWGWLEKNAVRYNNPEHPWLFPLQLAVGDKEEFLPFMQNPDHPGGCGFAGNGNIQVPVTTLDRWCEQNRVVPDFIKMDLEGAEGVALLGAEDIFKTYKPRFAVCLYHRLEDMWMLPRLLKAYVPEYRLWCKKSAVLSEFVLYGSI